MISWSEFVEAHKRVVPQMIGKHPDPVAQVFYEGKETGLSTAILPDSRPDDPKAIAAVKTLLSQAQASRFLYMIPTWSADADAPGAVELAERQMLSRLPEVRHTILLLGADREEGRVAFTSEHNGRSMGPWHAVEAQMRVLDALVPAIGGTDD